MAKRISVGEPINQAEERVFKYLEAKLPDDYIIFTNLSITQNGLDYDFDAIVLGRHAIYVVEVKNIGGSIRGNNFRWEVVGKDGALFTLPKNPLEQANLQRRILAGRLKHRDRKFGKLFVQDCVCLAGEEEPRFDIKDNPKRLNKVHWYKGIEEFLTDPDKLMYPPEWNLITDDITSYHADITKAIEEGFKSTPIIPHRIREFNIEGEAWVSSRYRAYLANRKTKYPYKCLLKIYPVPSEIQDKERWDFIRQLERELNAIRVIRDAGDPTIGGQKNVAIGYEAFPLTRSNEYAVVMEWVDGLPLSKELNTKKITLRQKYQIAAQICRGLAFAHTAGVVHRNLSLDNVIYNPHSGLVKIVNFDFAKFIAGSPVGTIRLAEEEAPTDTDIDIWKQYIEDMAQQRKYVAPEIRPKQGMPRYHDASPETDLYALGVMLFELFSEKVLASEAVPEINFLNAIDDLDPRITTWLTFLSSNKVERKEVALIDIANELTSLAQDYPQEIRLPELKLGSTFNKKYEISSLLSSTEMSVVYQARDNSLDQEVILKLLRASSEDALGEIQRTYKIWRDIDPQYTARWLDGGSVFARGDIIEESSQDPNAVRIYYLVMEYLEGRSLRELINEGQLDFEKTFDIAVKVIRAVAAIHQAEQIHRDIKPENLIQTLEGQIKIIDFGLSQRFDEVVEVKGVSPGYSPPEIFPGPDGNTQPWTYAGDVYSSACVLAALFCGEEHGHQPVLDPHLLKDAAGQALADLILYNLNDDSGKRHASAVEMLRDIEKIVMRKELSNRRDIMQLAKAISEAELLAGDGKLTDELTKVLAEARSAYDQIRVRHGDLRKLMRSGELESRWTARNELAEIVARGGEYILDNSTNTYEESFIVLREADILLEEQSENITQFELDEVNSLLPSYPAKALERIDKVLDLPLHEAHKSVLEEKRIEIRKLLADQNLTSKHNDSATGILRDEDKIDSNTDTDKKRSPLMATKFNYQEVVTKIREIADEEQDLDLARAESLHGEASQLEEWIKAGLQGECPLDISQYGFDFELKESISEPKDSPPSPEPGSVPETKKDTKSVKEVEAEPELEAVVEVVINETLVDEKDDQVDGVDVTEVQEVLVVTPEQAGLRKQLTQAREYLQAGELRQAVALAKVIESRASSEEREEVDSLLAEALPKFNAALDGFITKGDEAREIQNLEVARINYEDAIALDPENRHAQEALGQIDALINLGSTELSESKIKELRAGLRDRKDIKRLGRIVYEAEAFYAEDILGEELSELLNNARTEYDQLRIAMGEETTMMRFGDLELRINARNKIAERVSSGEKFVFDVTTNTVKDSYILLNEADSLIEEKSEITAQYEIDVINSLLPAHPKGALDRIGKALDLPLHDHHKHLLDKKRTEINLFIENQLIAKERTQKMNTIKEKIESNYEQAGYSIGLDNFSEALELISEAGNEYAKLLDGDGSDDELPQNLREIRKQGDVLRKEINYAKNIRKEFSDWAIKIRKDVGDEHRREQAIEQFEKLRLDERFVDLRELRELASEMDQYRDVAAKLKEAEQARSKKDWQRVYELAGNIRGKAGEYGVEVDKLYLEAEQELKIEEALRLLENLDVSGANTIISSLLKGESTTPERKQEFAHRLANENKIIDQAIRENSEMQNLFDRASLLKQSAIAKKLEALRLFRYIGGMNIAPPDKEWPEYKLSLRTAVAREQASELAENMRNKYLPTLQKAYEARSKKTQDAEELRKYNAMAEAMREGHLLNSEDERAYIRWVEVEWGKVQAEAKESTQDWRTAVQIWRKLDLNHPGTLDVESGLRGALIQNAVMEADRLIYNEHQEREAISVLHAVQIERGLNTSWEVLLKLSEAYSRIGEFEHAFGTLDEAGRFGAHKSTIKSKKAEIEREKIIQTALLNAENKISMGSPREAFIVLNEVLTKPTVQKSQRLRERRDQLFQSEQEKLLKIAQEARSSALDGDKVRAVTALVDLRELEELMELSNSKRRSEKELSKLKGDLIGVAETLLDNINNFDTTSTSLASSLSEAEKMAGRLQTFLEVIPLFEKELGEIKERLEKRRRNHNKELQKLKSLNILLEETKQASLWELAIKFNDFGPLIEKYQAIQAVELTRIPDFYRFERRLKEWQKIHAYLHEQIKTLKQLLNVEENYEKMIELLHRLTSRPDAESGGMDWQQLQHSDYEQILKIMDGNFRLVNIYGDGKDLVGRTDIEAEIIRRQQQLELWVDWDKGCQRIMELTQDAISHVEKYEPGAETVPYRHQHRDWSSVEEKAGQAVRLLKSEPQENGEVLPTFSEKSGKIRKEGLRRLEIVEGWYHYAKQALHVINEILKVKGFPSEEELNNTASQKDWVRLERLLTQAEQAGLLDEIEVKRIAVFKHVLRKAKEQQNKGFFDLFKRKG